MPKAYPLNFNWHFRVLDSSETEAFLNNPHALPNDEASAFSPIDIPHTMVEVPLNYFSDTLYQVLGHYKKTIPGITYEPTQAVTLHFQGVMVTAHLFVGDQYVGSHYGGYLPFSFRIDPYIQEGKAFDLHVIVDGREDPEVPPFGFVVDYLTYSGIYREVSLEVAGQTTIENCHVKTPNVLSDEKALHLDLYLSNQSRASGPFIVSGSLKHWQTGVNLESFTRGIEVTTHERQRFECFVPLECSEMIKLWHLENPDLYVLELQLIHQDQVVDQRAYRFGFRSALFTTDGFYLNGEKLKLRGLNRHQAYPYVGYAMPKSAQVKDAEILKKDLGVNIVRLSHYPQSLDFMNACDELGLLVFDEIPGWQHIGASDLWRKRTLQNVEQMIQKDWNHPSVVIWGVRINESKDCDDLYKDTNQLARSLDDTRATGGVRYLEHSHLLEDVYTYNDFSHTGHNEGLKSKRQVAGAEVPYLVTEFNGHMYPTKSFDGEPHRLDHALRHLNVLETAYAMETLSGAIGWCAFDYNTHKDFGSGDRICHHGVMNMFRMPKYAAAVYASQADEAPVLTVASSMNIGDNPAALLSETYIFTNCDFVKVYQNGLCVGQHSPARGLYQHIPRPPVIIREYIGDRLITEQGFSPKDSDQLKRLFAKLAKAGSAALSPLDKALAAKIMVKYKLTYTDLYQLFGKYMNNWGSEATTYTYEGYLDGIKVISVTKGQTDDLELQAIADQETLTITDTYDVTRICLTLSDTYGTPLTYTDEVVTVSTTGPIALIGPKTFSLQGGQRAFWIKTFGQPNPPIDSDTTSATASVTITSERFGSKTLTFSICYVKETMGI